MAKSTAFKPGAGMDMIGESGKEWKEGHFESLKAVTFTGNLNGKATSATTADRAAKADSATTAGTADTATKAMQDKNGNDIPSTYATKNELAGYSLVNGVPSFTYTV